MQQANSELFGLLEIEIDRLKLKEFTSHGRLSSKDRERLRRLVRARRVEIREQEASK